MNSQVWGFLRRRDGRQPSLAPITVSASSSSPDWGLSRSRASGSSHFFKGSHRDPFYVSVSIMCLLVDDVRWAPAVHVLSRVNM